MGEFSHSAISTHYANGCPFPLQVNIFNCVCTLIAYLNPLHLIVSPLQRKLVKKEISQAERHSDSSSEGDVPIIRQKIKGSCDQSSKA